MNPSVVTNVGISCEAVIMMRSLDQDVFENEQSLQTPTQVWAGGGGAADL